MKIEFNSERTVVENNNTCENIAGIGCWDDCSEIILTLYPTTFPLASSSAGFSQDTLREYGESEKTEGGVMNTGAINDNDNSKTMNAVLTGFQTGFTYLVYFVKDPVPYTLFWFLKTEEYTSVYKNDSLPLCYLQGCSPFSYYQQRYFPFTK